MTSEPPLAPGARDTPEPTPSLPTPKPTLRKFVTRLGASLAVAGAMLWLMKRGGLPVVPRREAFANVQWWTVAAYFLSLGVVHWFRAWRWDYLLRPIARVPTRRIIAIAWIGFFAIMMLPLRMGEVVRPVLLRRDGKVTGSAAMGTIAAERVLDGLFVAVLLAVTLVFVPRLPLDGVKVGDVPLSSVPRMGFLLVVVFTSALLVLAFFLAARRLAEKLTMRIVGVVSPRLATRLSGMMGGLADGLRSLPDPRLMGPFLFQTAIYWVVNALGMWFLGWGCGLDMTPAQGFAVMGVLAMGILLPAGPGLFGTFQLSVFVALRMYLPENVVMREGAAYVFLMYLCQFVFHTVAGLGALWVEHIKASDALGNGDAR